MKIIKTSNWCKISQLNKQPWEMTRKEYIKIKNKILGVSSQKRGYLNSYILILKSMHKKYVKDAVLKGKPVPIEVLNDYPDIKNNLKINKLE